MAKTDKNIGEKINPYQNTIKVLSRLLFDALKAGRYIESDAKWEPYEAGKSLRFRDRNPKEERSGSLILIDTITKKVSLDSATSPLTNYIIVGGNVDDKIDFGKNRLKRLESMRDHSQHYWANFALEDKLLITLGTPSSPCRLIGEVLNLQVHRPFIQRRICRYCHMHNDYHNLKCRQCKKPLATTGRL